MANTPKCIGITGATGFIATNLRKSLSSKYKLVSFSRNNFISFKNEVKVITNYDDYSKLASSALCNCDVLIHLIGIGRQNTTFRYNDINTQITSNLIQACRSTPIKKIIYLSGLGVSSKNTSNYFISKYHAERIIINSGLDYTVFRPSYIIGKNDYLTKSLNSQIKKNKILIPETGNYIIQPIHISNVVNILHDSILKKKFSNKIIDLVGSEQISFRKYIESFLRKNKKNIKIVKIPLDECIKNALTDPKCVYSLDDLNILFGGFIGNFEKLQKIYSGTIIPIKSFL